MRILIFLSHPAQFLFYKNPVLELKKRGHDVLLLIKTKDILANLLDEAGLDYHNIVLKPRGKSKMSILLNLLKRDFRLLRFARKRKINLLMGSDASLAHVGKLLNIPCITTLEDDYDVIKILAKLTYPFTTSILAPNICSVGPWAHKKIDYEGYMKLSYLHPNVFKPDRSKVMVEESQPFFLLRLSGLGAHHDFGIDGLSSSFLLRIIEQLVKHGRVFISSENPLLPEYEKYRLNIPLSNIHHYLYFAEMFISDSQSMSVEAAMLGTPSIRISGFAGKISVLEELEHKYQLTHGFKPKSDDAILAKIEELITTPTILEQYQKQRFAMLSDKIDVSAFLIWFIENYPSSFETMKNNPDYQYRFRGGVCSKL